LRALEEKDQRDTEAYSELLKSRDQVQRDLENIYAQLSRENQGIAKWESQASQVESEQVTERLRIESDTSLAQRKLELHYADRTSRQLIQWTFITIILVIASIALIHVYRFNKKISLLRGILPYRPDEARPAISQQRDLLEASEQWPSDVQWLVRYHDQSPYTNPWAKSVEDMWVVYDLDTNHIYERIRPKQLTITPRLLTGPEVI